MADMMHNILMEVDRTDELLHRSLKEINDKGDLTQQSLEVLGNVLDAIKDSCEIHEKSEWSEDRSYGRNSYGRWEADGSYDMMSGRRDSRGRYAPRSYGYDHYDSRSYDGHKDAYTEDLERQMSNAKSEQEREVIRRMIREREGR